MTTLIAYHQNTKDVAVFQNDDGLYWIGGYSKFLTHQNGEPPYVLIVGHWEVEQDALDHLRTMSGNEF
jgi:septal ring-binding cell division protein DamX